MHFDESSDGIVYRGQLHESHLSVFREELESLNSQTLRRESLSQFKLFHGCWNI